jgi:hypothetical protein
MFEFRGWACLHFRHYDLVLSALIRHHHPLCVAVIREGPEKPALAGEFPAITGAQIQIVRHEFREVTVRDLV